MYLDLKTDSGLKNNLFFISDCSLYPDPKEQGKLQILLGFTIRKKLLVNGNFGFELFPRF